ncbi:MAG: hypothetical protein D6754_08835 [Alphaproteobacteria bacterium]|nr:MAG: hypothetical protein D6754_08835 [Alphaproteobacteria bacterium]
MTLPHTALPAPLPEAVVLALSAAGTEAQGFRFWTGGVRILLLDNRVLNDMHVAVDRAGVFHFFKLEIGSGLTQERREAREMRVELSAPPDQARLACTAPGREFTALLPIAAAIRFAQLGADAGLTTLYETAPAECQAVTLCAFKPGRAGFPATGEAAGLIEREDGSLILLDRHGAEPAEPLPSWSRSGRTAELLFRAADGAPLLVVLDGSEGKVPARFRKAGPPDVTPVRSAFAGAYWLEPHAQGTNAAGRLLSLEDGVRFREIGRDWSEPALTLVAGDLVAYVENGAPVALRVSDDALAHRIAAAARHSPEELGETIACPARVIRREDGSGTAEAEEDESGRTIDAAPAAPAEAAGTRIVVLEASGSGLTIEGRSLAYAEMEAWVELDDRRDTVLHVEMRDGSRLEMLLPDRVAREIWRRQETSAVTVILSNRGIGERYEHYHEVSRRRILFELFNDMLVIEKELNREGPIIELIRRFQEHDAENPSKVDKKLMEQVTDRLVSLWLVTPPARRRVNEMLFYYPYFLSEEQARFDQPFVPRARNPDVFEEGLAAQPVRSELSRVLLPMLQGLAELEASLSPVERILSESKIKNTFQYRASPFMPLIGQGVTATAALIIGSPLAFGMIGGAVVSSLAGQLLKSSMDEATTWRQLSAAADRTLPAWTSLSMKIPVLMAEADAVIRRLQAAGMQRTRKLIDASPLPMPEKRDKLLATLDEAIFDETDSWFREVDEEKGIYPALAASGLSQMTAQAARNVVRQAQLNFMKGRS